jgi:hypothetical protein
MLLPKSESLAESPLFHHLNELLHNKHFFLMYTGQKVLLRHENHGINDFRVTDDREDPHKKVKHTIRKLLFQKIETSFSGQEQDEILIDLKEGFLRDRIQVKFSLQKRL